jgi:hypothetical protein
MTTPNRTHRSLLASLITLTLAGHSLACAAPEDGDTEVPELRAVAEGPLGKEAVRAVVAAEIADVRKCYNTELLDDGSIAGNIAIAFVIAADGTVSELEVVDSSMPARFDACIGASVASWTFPPADGPTTVMYPFWMEPG